MLLVAALRATSHPAGVVLFAGLTTSSSVTSRPSAAARISTYSSRCSAFAPGPLPSFTLRLSEFARAAQAENAELARRQRRAEQDRPYWRDVPARMDRLARALLAAGTVGDGPRRWADRLCAGATELKRCLADAPANEWDRLLTLPELAKDLRPSRVNELDDGAFGEAKEFHRLALDGQRRALSAALAIAADLKGKRAAAIRDQLRRLLCRLFRRCQGHLALKFRAVDSVDGEFYRGPFDSALRVLYAPVGDPVAVSQAEDVAGTDGLRVVTPPPLEGRIGGDPSRTSRQLRYKYGGVFRMTIRPARRKNAGGHRIYIVAAESYSA